MLKRSRLPKVSRRQRERLAEYKRVLRAWLPLHPQCELGPKIREAGYQVCCKGKTTHPHHIKGRIGINLCDTSSWLASCSGECHPQFVHQTHVKESREMGILQ